MSFAIFKIFSDDTTDILNVSESLEGKRNISNSPIHSNHVSSDESKVADTVPNKTAQSVEHTSNIPSEELIADYKSRLLSELELLGFSEGENRFIVSSLVWIIKNPQPMGLNAVLLKIEEKFNLDEERAKTLNAAVMRSFQSSGASTKLKDWEDCLDFKMQQLQLSECGMRTVDDYRAKMLKLGENGVFDYDKLQDEGEKYTRDARKTAVSECNLDPAIAIDLFSTIVSNCTNH